MRATDLDSYAVIETNLDATVASILESRYLDPKVLKQKIRLCAQVMAMDLMKSQEDEVEKQIKETISKLDQIKVKNAEFYRLSRNLQRLNLEKKKIRRGYHKIKEYNEYLLLKKFVRHKFGEEVFNEFVQWQNEFFSRIGKAID
jgi:hypothetical protein